VGRTPGGPAIELGAYRAELVGGELHLTDHDAVRWVSPGDLASFALTEPDRPVAACLVKGQPAGASRRQGDER
jgi:hypothetical protein